MPKSYETNNFGDYFELPNPNLRAYFGNVVKGQPKVYDTPFAVGETMEQLLNSWSKVLESIRLEWPSLYDFENDLRSKVGPLSIMKPLSERMDDIDSYYSCIHSAREPIRSSALAAVAKEWRAPGTVRLRSERDTIDNMKLSTNSGAPYFRRKNSVVDCTYPVHIYNHDNTIYQVLAGNRDHVWKTCAVLGWRGQEGGPSEEDTKQRVVWMFPFGVNIRELQVYQPLVLAAQKAKLVPAWVSQDEVDSRVTALFDSKGSKDLIICTDFSKFDQHFNPCLQDAARTILASILTPDRNAATWLKEVFPVKYNIPLAYNYGMLRYGSHGMASGSGGTNADETLVHRALQYEAAQLNGRILNPNSQCHGDDGILTYPGITVEDVVDAYTAHGLEMNQSKQYASTQCCIYLKRWYHDRYRLRGICRGVYSTFRALGRLRYLERFMDPEVWDSRMVALRQLSILENVKYHPLANDFAEFCMKRDKYRLGIDIPGFLDNIGAIASRATDVMPDFLGYTRSLQLGGDFKGLSDWWIVKYLKERA